MNAITRRSSRLADKPAPRYKETRDRNPRNVNKGTAETAQDRPEGMSSLEVPDQVPNLTTPEVIVDKPARIESRNKLFEVSSGLGIAFPECIKDRYDEDAFFKPILANPEEFTNFAVRGGLVFFKSEGIETISIPNVRIGEQSVREILIRQGHSILAHLSDEKTATYLRDQVWWKTMIADVTDYCRSCQTCAISKPQNGRPHGKLKTMPVPVYPWQYIGVDFVGPLPESMNRMGGYDMICVIIDLLTSMVHLVASKQTYRATDITELMFEAVYKLHGLPERIISDRDSLFTSKFWKRLHRLVGTELRMSSAFHPQTDGATERANRTVTQMIRQCVQPNQKDWVIKLPAIEFAINSARSSTTGFSPFQLNYGRNPSPMIWKGQEEFPGVREFAERMKMAIMSAHDSIIAAQVVNTVQANRKRVSVDYKVGDLVYLSTKNISLPKGRARKLAPKYLGPFAITAVLKEGATYQLDLSDELLKQGINRSFHASLLKPHVPNDDRRFPGRLPSQIPGFGEKPEEWIIEAITAHHGKGIKSDFEVLWKAGDRTWAPYREVAHLIALDRYCELMGVEGPNSLPAAYPKRGGDPGISVGAARLGGNAYIRGGVGWLRRYLPTMARDFSPEEWYACVTFAAQLEQYLRGTSQTPPGRPPARYPEYMRTLDREAAPTNTIHSPSPYYAHQYGHTAPAPQNTVSMPPGSLKTLLNTQVQMLQLVTGRGKARPNRSGAGFYGGPRRFGKEYHPDYALGYYLHGRGAYRGPRFGRARPSGSMSRKELARDLSAINEDIAMSDASLFSELDLFTTGSSNVPGPSTMAASTSVAASTSAQMALSPGLPLSSLVLAHVNGSPTELEEIADRLVNDMGGIDIGGSVPSEDDEVVVGKGKGVARPGESKNVDFDFD